MRPVVIRLTAGTLGVLSQQWTDGIAATWQEVSLRDTIMESTVLRDGGVQVRATHDTLNILQDTLDANPDAADAKKMLARILKARVALNRLGR